MLELDLERVRTNVRQATTEDLLDRATVYRAGMEPEALAIIEAELCARGVLPHQVDAHASARQEACIPLHDGTCLPCSFCDRPAVARGWNWHRLWGIVPVMPRYFAYCDEHRPAEW